VKKEFTATVIKELNLEISIQYAYNIWWFTNTESNLRLTKEGFNIISKHVEFCTFPMPPADAIALSLNLYRNLGKIRCPYYIQRKKGVQISIFSSKISTIISLYPDLAHYLNTLE